MSYHFKFGNGKYERKINTTFYGGDVFGFYCYNEARLRLVYTGKGPSNGTARLENCKKMLKCQNYLLLRDI